MWPHTPRRVLKFALPTIAAVGAGAAVAVAAIPSNGPFNACVLKSAQGPLPKGAVRIVDAPTESCDTNTETSVTFGKQGDPGLQGPPGDPGPAGADAVGSGDSSSSDSSSSSSNDTFSTPTQAGGPSADMFLKLDGIAGDSTDDKHKGEIDVTSFAFSLGRGGDGTGTGSHATGAKKSATKGRLQTLRIDKVYDASSPKLFRAAATGQHIRSAVLTFRRSNDSGDAAFLTYTLTDVQVTSYDQGGKDGDARDLGSLEEEVGLTAAKVHVTQRTPGAHNPDKPGAVVSADWTVPKQAG